MYNERAGRVLQGEGGNLGWRFQMAKPNPMLLKSHSFIRICTDSPKQTMTELQVSSSEALRHKPGAI
jgi:hypothetical protein